MNVVDKLDWEILNATADDHENLEQIYLAVCFELVRLAEDGYMYRRINEGVLLSEIADRIAQLTRNGLLSATEEDGQPLLETNEFGCMSRAWFRMSPKGRSVWTSSEPTTVVQPPS